MRFLRGADEVGARFNGSREEGESPTTLSERTPLAEYRRYPYGSPKKNAEKIQLFVPILRFLLLFRAILPF